jgi:D-3-phosphoglycerate dehydrogenase
MEIAYWSASSRDDRHQYLDLDELFRAVDVLSVSLALTPQTRMIVDARLLGLMKPSAILINTGRGEMIDEDALAAAISEGRIAGAGLDVMAEEPPRDAHPLFAFDNVVITPHVATITDITYRRMCVDIAREVSRMLKGDDPDAQYIRNPQVLGRRRKR